MEWAAGAGPLAKAATFFDAAADGEVVINATPGTVSLDVLAAASTRNLDGKVLIDVANPLDHSAGFPPSLSISNTDSLAETIQRAFPDGQGGQGPEHHARRRHGGSGAAGRRRP